MDTNILYENTINLLKKAGVEYREVEHEPVLSYEKAEEVRKRFNLTGTENKSLFMKAKDGRYLMFISIEGKRVDSKAIKDLVGSKVSFCSAEELTEQTGCVAGCATPFGHKMEITLIVDKDIFAKTGKYIFSPGPAKKTIEIDIDDVKKILEASENPIVYYMEPFGN